jgi:hypothetical protein
MKYIPPRPPISRPPGELSRPEARRFFDWYKEQIAFRNEQLFQVVTFDRGYSDWTNDFSPESLNALASWYEKNVRTRKRTETEREAIYQSAPAWFRHVEVDDWVLTDRTFSYAFDVGIYFGEVLKKSIDGMDWELKVNAPSAVDYHLPILHCEGSLDCCPYHLMKMYAYGIARKTQGSERLRELYAIWVVNLTRPRQHSA